MLAQASVPPIEEEMIHQSTGRARARALGELDGKEREVVRLRFGLDATASRARCRRSATRCTSRASASGRSNRARRKSCADRSVRRAADRYLN